ncbi:MAG: hypothetical protein ACAI35_18575 [Candidatus Methylacidiphilales bacterium]|nr:hypothetical protein [Candidatus Methylacidiphilales bacterium]
MKLISTFLYAIAAVAAMFMVTHAAFAQNGASEPPFRIPTQYSIVFIQKLNGVTRKSGLPSRMYVDGTRFRTETITAGAAVTLIHRPDINKTYALKEATREYKEVIYNKKYNPFMAEYPPGKWSTLKPAELAGKMMRRYQLDTGEPGKAVVTHVYWVDPATKMFMRIEINMPGAKAEYECSDYKADRPSSELFEVPKDYTPVDKKSNQDDPIIESV